MEAVGPSQVLQDPYGGLPLRDDEVLANLSHSANSIHDVEMRHARRPLTHTHNLFIFPRDIWVRPAFSRDGTRSVVGILAVSRHIAEEGSEGGFVIFFPSLANNVTLMAARFLLRFVAFRI